jgi:hypothetical protein
MSFLLHHPLEFVGLLLNFVGLGLMLPSAWPMADTRKSSALSALGSVIFNLGLVVLVTAPSIGSIDAWSAGEKAIGAGVLLFLFYTGVQLGIAIERWRRQKPGANDAQRVGPVELS